MTTPKNLKILTHPFSHLLRYVLNVSPLSNRTSIVATTPFPLTERISCYLRHILSASSHDIHVYSTNKEFWQQNLATSKFLVKCLLLTASFLTSRKHYESFALKHYRHYHQLLQRRGSTNHL